MHLDWFVNDILFQWAKILFHIFCFDKSYSCGFVVNNLMLVNEYEESCNIHPSPDKQRQFGTKKKC